MKEAFRLFAQSITGASIPDLNSGLRAFRREVAERYFDLLPDRFSFTTTTTVAAIADGLAVRFTPIEYLPRTGRSKVRPIPDTLRIGRQVLRLGIRFAPLRTAAWVAGTCAVMFALSSAWHAATSGPASADVGYLVAGGAVLALGAYGEGRRPPAPAADRATGDLSESHARPPVPAGPYAPHHRRRRTAAATSGRVHVRIVASDGGRSPSQIVTPLRTSAAASAAARSRCQSSVAAAA